MQSDHNSIPVPNDKVGRVSIENGGGNEVIEKQIPYNGIPLNVLQAMSTPTITAASSTATVAEQTR